MNFDSFYNYCITKAGVEESFPFNETTLVMKVMGKMFALTALDKEGFSVNLKCDPDWALELREEHPEITAGFHMNKKHWNTVDLQGDLPSSLVREMIDHSYALVVAKLPKKLKEELEAL